MLFRSAFVRYILNVHRSVPQYGTMHKQCKYVNIDMGFVYSFPLGFVHVFVQFHYAII